MSVAPERNEMRWRPSGSGGRGGGSDDDGGSGERNRERTSAAFSGIRRNDPIEYCNEKRRTDQKYSQAIDKSGNNNVPNLV